jgi:hypothetical protein
MKLMRKMAEARHFLALLGLALWMSVFAAGAGRAAMESKTKALRDPVIGSLSWEQSNADGGMATLSDGPFAACEPNCGKNCPLACDGNCNPNCVPNCECNCPYNCV